MKFYYYAVIILGMIILLNAGGVETPTGGALLGAFNMMSGSGADAELTISDAKSSDLWGGSSNSLRNILLGLAVSGLVIGAFGRAPQINYLTAGLVFLLSGFLVGDLISIATQLNSYDVWMRWASFAIFAPLIVGFFITALEFWQGTD